MSTATKDPSDVFVDNWMEVIGNICWAQDQGEKVLRHWVEQSRVTREEAREIAHKLAAQVRQNQEEMQKWVRATVEMSMAACRPATVAQLEELTRKVDELTRKVEELNKRK